LEPSTIQAANELVNLAILLFLISGENGMHEGIEVNIFEIMLILLPMELLLGVALMRSASIAVSTLRVDTLNGKAGFCPVVEMVSQFHGEGMRFDALFFVVYGSVVMEAI
jgi:hypothetical protein